MLLAQLQDPRLVYIHEVLGRQARDAEEEQIKLDFALKDNRVFRKVRKDLKWAVPRAARRNIVRLCHDEMGHVGEAKTLDKLESEYWFPSMRRYVKRYIAACLDCLYSKEPAGKKPGHLHPIAKVAEPMHTIHIDHLGPFVTSAARNTQILVMVDSFTKYVFVKAVRNTKTLPVLRVLDTVSETFGFPRRIISDRGTAFTSKNFKEYCQEKGIRHVATAVATPRANGQVERYNRTILGMLSASAEEERSWDRELPRIVWGLNNTVNKATGKYPSELLLGFRPRGAAESRIINSLGEVASIPSRDQARKEAEEVIKRNQKDQEARYNRKRALPRQFNRNDLVMVRRVVSSNEGSSKKLLPKYAGPYQVTKVLNNDRYVVEDVKGAERTQKPYCGVVPGEKLKHCATEVSDSDSEGSGCTDVPHGTHMRKFCHQGHD